MAENTVETKEKVKQTKQKMVTIKLPIVRGESNEDVFVGLNGNRYLIKRGVAVEVPEGVAEILENQEKMLARCIKFDEEFADKGE